MTDTGYSLEEIRAERARRQQQQQSTRVQAAAGGQPVSVEAIRRERARRAQANAPPPPRTAADDAEGGLAAANQGLFLGLGDEIVGTQGRFLESGREFVRQLSSGDDYNPDAIRDAGARGYRMYADRSRGALQDFREERPLTAAFAEGTGAAAPIVATMGASAPATVAGQAPARGLAAWGQQTLRGAASGGTYGAAYGLGATDGDLGERLDGANTGAGVGAALGGLAPTAMNAAGAVIDRTIRPAWRALQPVAERIPTPTPNTVGMGGGNMFAGGGSGALRRPPQEPPPQIPPDAIRTIDRMARRERMSVDDVANAFDDARANPQGQAVVDLFEDTGVRTLRPMVQGPGETSRRATESARALSEEAPEIIMNTLRRGLNVGETRAAAVARLEGDYRRLSLTDYEPIFAREMTPQQMALYEQRIAPLLSPENPNTTVREIMQNAIVRAERQFDLDLQGGIVQGQITDNLPRYLHYIKGAIGERAQFDASPLRGVSGREVRSIRDLYRQFGDLIDPPSGAPIVPGYRETTARAGDYYTATEALEDGARLLNGSVDDAVARFRDATPFETDHLRIGLADEVRRLTAGDANRNANVAAVLGNRNRQQIIRAAFDTPEQAAEFLATISGGQSRGVPGLYRLTENRQQIRGGSPTHANAMHAEDEAVSAGVDTAARIGTGDFVGGARRAAEYARNYASLGMVERANNRRGEVLLRRIDREEARAFTDEIVRLLREREAQAAATTAASAPLGAQTGVAGERNRRAE